MTNSYVRSIVDTKFKDVGEKSDKLRYLLKRGYTIPQSYVCTFSAYEEYVRGNTEILNLLGKELQNFVDETKLYSVRSSANVEDLPGRSFAGQFKSYLNLKGISSILESIEQVWESTKSDRLRVYLTKFGFHWDELKMAVIVQEMVPAKISGVVFTRNPMNGRDEVIVEAVHGLGDKLMTEGFTPCRWVYKWGDWIEIPDDDCFELELIHQLVRQAREIEKKYGKPLNLEWAYDGVNIYWLQLREITTISGLNFYSNKIPKEFLPGIIKPLVWSVNIPLVCGAWIKLLTEITGENTLKPEDLAKSFYYRAYFNMGVIGDVFDIFGMPREALELLMGFEVAGKEKPTFKPSLKSMRLLPRMMRFTLDKLFFSRKMGRFMKNQAEKIGEFNLAKISTLSDKDTIRILDELFEVNKKAAYYVIVSQLLNSVYNLLLKRSLEKEGLNEDEIVFGLENYKDIDPNYHLSRLHADFTSLPVEKTLGYDQLTKTDGLSDFQNKIDNFLIHFGHLSDKGNDFSSVPWRESPDLVLNMIIDYAQPEEGLKPKRGSRAQLRGRIKNIYNRARKYREYKERISFSYTYSYGLFRPYFLHLGEIFEEKGYVEDKGDIFFLTFNEIKNIVNSETMPHGYSNRYLQRKKEIAEFKDLEMPEVIYGDEPPAPINKNKIQRELTGIAASKGYYQGRIRVVRSLTDFNKVKEGDILVIPHSDIGWAPLFAKAKAVVSEAGGILSHSAIVAREYGIPAIVGVDKACELKDDAEAVVDGFTGSITILD